MTNPEDLYAAEYLSWLDVHFARTVTRIGGDQRREILLAAALASRAVRQSHVCLDLENLSREDVLYDSGGTPVVEGPWPRQTAWLEALCSSPLVGSGIGDTPLVLDGGKRLYLRRYWEHEVGLAQALRARAGTCNTSIDPIWMRRTLDRLFEHERAPAAEIDWQRMAALLAALRRLCVISGGPGTGKTFTVVKILALLVELAFRNGQRTPRILLLAPTGKAAARLVESIRNVKAHLRAADAVKAAIPEVAATIHRGLSSIGGSTTRFRHDAKNPLSADVVLVDEASMVDVALMARLVDAVPPGARLILLGDKDQLASVEAGAVLGDICNSGAARSYSHAFAREVGAQIGEPLPVASDAPQQTGIWDCIVQLTRSYRYAADSRIGALARAVNDGDTRATSALLEDPSDTTIARVDPSQDWTLSENLRAAVAAGFGPYLREDDPAVQLRLLDRFRVLCAHRRGASGVETLNRQVEEALRDAGFIKPDAPNYVGRPLMVRRNDYQLRLFNGDVGIVARDPQRRDARLVMFDGNDGELRSLSAARLPPHETVFAMSIHKSQGSELDEVAVVLPTQSSPILTRELLYTAISRARVRVTLHASAEIIQGAVARRIERSSGLADRLWS